VQLLDLDLGSDYVRAKIISYLNRLIEIGVAGFRVDAVKHMWPQHLVEIYDRLNDLNTEAGFSPYTRPFIYNEASIDSYIYSHTVCYAAHGDFVTFLHQVLRCTLLHAHNNYSAILLSILLVRLILYSLFLSLIVKLFINLLYTL